MEFNVSSWLPGRTITGSEIIIISKTSRNPRGRAERRACVKGSGSPIYLLTWTPSGRPQIATSLVKMTMAFAILKKSGCPIYPSHQPWECKLHEKDSSRAEGRERRRKACLTAFQRLLLHSKWHLHPSLKSLHWKLGCQMPAATESWGGKERLSFWGQEAF